MAKRSPAYLDALVRAALDRLGAATAAGVAAAVADAGSPMTEVQVYRVLGRLVVSGDVRPVLTGRRFMSADPARPDCVTLVCVACDGIEVAPTEDITADLADLARSRGFRVASVVAEVAGICARCNSGSPIKQEGD
ncbi:MAG: hypothetical protein INF91_01055 [Alphaproteobacteria bacterium]|nr:hypothetical protein [Alphaproteobacteria bacterium]